jgi:hypothetical protein
MVWAGALAALVAFGCDGGSSTGSHVNAITGAACTVDPGSYMPPDPNADGPTVNCSAHHDDVPQPGDECCEFPQPGCDDQGCCDEEVIDGEPGGGEEEEGPEVH